MREIWGKDHASVGMRTPSGEYELPIRGTRLLWMKPGNTAVFLFFKKQTVYLPLSKDRKTFSDLRRKKRLK